ncbi:aspartyl-tRNA(Asn)/glutamyl-tRNA(Gln) amidotransferase subunit A [Pseudaminobacter salicylatoxidans]|uniref:Aspartyl-tRNA(Asn)/glutamyl-tRNA(Gln) amidotransferase subunit A n=1 Tax=Pseudaminobacter salicylatoxidans TaxID=93369 RepID=A0A316CPR1_PSESE|nr:amidase [Pseudaminobacter salicylatoxidans]PWJ84174.1 aspartyl-tRNA(Asn)/glutamyl-tRNA(Gln) amidotransferase subunit A [Pseudaminobacter salicylatoxidans]
MQSSRDRLEAILARLEARAAGEKVFTRIYAAAARAAADAADARRAAGVSLGALDGRIVSIKDLFDVEGEPTVAGSPIRRDAEPAMQDAVVVRRLRQAGAVIVGKTAMTEFAFTAVGSNPGFGTPGNAVDPARVPGGSSSGAGVSAAEGTSEIAIGSDTGGSVRIPAALNGVVGFKPTAGRIPLGGVFPLSFTLDSVGPLAKTVADCVLADAVMAGGTYAAPRPMPLTGLRIGIPHGRLLRDMEPEIEAGFERSLRLLEAAGARIVDHRIDDLIEKMLDAASNGSIASIEAAALHSDWLGDETLAAQVDPRVARTLARRAGVPASAYIKLIQRRNELARAMDERLAPFDVLALPTTPVVAPLIEVAEESINSLNRTDDILLRNPQVANQFDLTAISLPMPEMELPGGLMLFARNGHDDRLFSIAAAVEAELARAER